MLLPNDFRRAANYLISRYGAEAGDRAASRATELREAGENDLHQIWSVLAATIVQLHSSQRPRAARRRDETLPDRAQ